METPTEQARCHGGKTMRDVPFKKKLWQMIDSIVLNIPHSSSEFPGTAKDGWENEIDEHIQRWTDWGTDPCSGWPHPWIPAFILSPSPGQDSSAMWSVCKTIRRKKSVRASSIHLSKESGGTLPEQISSTGHITLGTRLPSSRS